MRKRDRVSNVVGEFVCNKAGNALKNCRKLFQHYYLTVVTSLTYACTHSLRDFNLNSASWVMNIPLYAM